MSATHASLPSVLLTSLPFRKPEGIPLNEVNWTKLRAYIVLRRAGWSHREIAHAVGRDERTLYRWLRMIREYGGEL